MSMYRGTPLAPGAPSRSIGLAECLRLPEMAGARVLVSPREIDLQVTWVTVIEWPVENFVSPHDLVLTTGISCDERQLREMVRQIASSGAAAVCLCTGDGAFHQNAPPSIVRQAEASGVVLIELPWQTRFADISRAVIGALYDPGSAGLGGLPAEFTVPLLGSSGMPGVAEALEEVADGPVVVLDSTLAKCGWGQRGEQWLKDQPAELALIDTLSQHLADGRRTQPGEVIKLSAGGHAALVCPVAVPGGVLGWVALIDAALQADTVEPALVHAATAAAIELLRTGARDRAESCRRERFLWEVANGSVDSLQELAARAALLGLSLSSKFTVGVGLLESIAGEGVEQAVLSGAVGQLRRSLTDPDSVVAVSDHEILLCLHARDDRTITGRADLLRSFGSLAVTFGYAEGRHNLTSLASAASQARRVLAVVRALHGHGSSGRAEHVRAYLLLQRVADDAETRRLVAAIMGPLETADAARRSQLVKTLAAYLDANGNIASAARALHLNRHSLIYRLKKIADLTGLDVNEPDDRLMIEMCLKVRQLQAIPPAPANDHFPH